MPGEIRPSAASDTDGNTRPSAASDVDGNTRPSAASDVDGNIFVELTDRPLSAGTIIDKVRSPTCGAIVLFAGTTRDNFQDKPVKHLAYTSYTPLASRTLYAVAAEIRTKHTDVYAVAIAHRLGVVPIGEESVLIAVSSPHRQAAWRAGEEALELVKRRAEIWKLEEFGGEEGGVWRANRDGTEGVKVGIGDLASYQVGPDQHGRTPP